MTDNAILQKLQEHDRRFQTIDERLDQLLSKEEFATFRQNFYTMMDQAMVILQRLDQERVFTNERIKRIEADLAHQQAELRQIKQILKIG
jgi:hypothetical protein